METIVQQYLSGLQPHLSLQDRKALAYATGATSEQLARLTDRYPDCPVSLLELLRHINGTYWQQYGPHTVSVLLLGSDIFEYPYYLKSVEQILQENNYNKSIRDIYGGYMQDMPGLVDVGIDPDTGMDRWLCFSDCMNNGGTSRLYIDFNPSPSGTRGQIIRFLHDPDSYKVIAASFDQYLEMLIQGRYAFILPEE